MNLTVRIQNGSRTLEPIVKSGASLKRIKNGASTFNFTIINDSILSIQEGNTVTVVSESLAPFGQTHLLFKGYIFKISPNKNGEISVTAYDQIRYLSNTDTYVYDNKTLSDLLKMICDDCQLKHGSDIVETGYIIPNRVEDNKSYLDMILTAMQLTVQNGGKEYILWDNFGEIALHDTEFFKIPLIISNSTAQDFSFEISIDSETYNQIKLFRETDDGSREVFVKNDPGTIGRWGLLQTSETLGKDENGDVKATEMLSQSNRRKATLSVSNAFGDIRVRGGSVVHVEIDTFVDMGFSYAQGKTTNMWMMVKEVTHHFDSGIHTMDLDLTGGSLVYE